jgi:hypothetical protein
MNIPQCNNKEGLSHLASNLSPTHPSTERSGIGMPNCNFQDDNQLNQAENLALASALNCFDQR